MNGLSALMFENVTFAAFRITQNFSGELINSLLNCVSLGIRPSWWFRLQRDVVGARNFYIRFPLHPTDK